MAQKTQLRLTPNEKRSLTEAMNLMYHGEKLGDPTMSSVGDKVYSTFADNPQKIDALAEFEATFEYNENFDTDSFSTQYAFIRKTFYATTGAGGGGVLFVRRHKAQKADELVNFVAGATILENKFGGELMVCFRKYWSSFAPATVSREYHPNGPTLIKDDYALYANTWVPPTIKHSKCNNPTERPSFWQQYLDRLMPKEHLCWWLDRTGDRNSVLQQNYFEAWLAQRVCKPTSPNNVSVVLRGNFGTGKGFWLDTIAHELVGSANYQPVTTKAWKGDFNGDMFDSVIIHLEETNDSRGNTADMLKMLITQDRHRANVKNLPQKFVQRHFAIAISSNYHSPIKIDQHDRRYFVPVWSDHLTGAEGKNETQAFFEDFSHWLKEEGGFQKMRDWLEQVPTADYNFRMAPDSDAKQDISSHSEPSEGRKTQLFAWLQSQRNKEMVFTSSELQKHNYPMTDVDVQQALRQAGYVSVRRSWKMEGGSKPTYLWVPMEQKDTHHLASKGWTLWQGGGGHELGLPDEEGELDEQHSGVDLNRPSEKDSTAAKSYPEEKEMLLQVTGGKAVVANKYRHPKIISWAEAANKLVNIQRGTVYGNPEIMQSKSDEERDRVCDVYEYEHVKKLSEHEIKYLKGKVLMCCCKPARCHGDTLALLANGE